MVAVHWVSVFSKSPPQQSRSIDFVRIVGNMGSFHIKSMELRNRIIGEKIRIMWTALPGGHYSELHEAHVP